MIKRFFCLAAFAIVLSSFLTGSVEARVIRVNPYMYEEGDGSSWRYACSSIYSAVVTAASGDEIWVMAGEYGGWINIVDKDIAIYGGFSGDETEREQRDWRNYVTVVDANGEWSVFYIDMANTTLDGLIITGAGGAAGAIYGYRGSLRIRNCKIVGNHSIDGGGVKCVEASAVIVNCLISGNRGINGGGVSCGDEPVSIINCTIVGNRAREGAGIYYGDSSQIDIVNSILWNLGSEMPIVRGATMEVSHSCVQGGWPGEGNFDAEPMFADREAGDYRLRNNSPCIDRGLPTSALSLDIDGNFRPGGDGLVDVGAYESPDEYVPGPANHTPKVFYVKSDASPGGDGFSWGTAFSKIASALWECGSSDELHVATGRYFEAIVMEKGVSIFGGYTGEGDTRLSWPLAAEQTVIDATGLGMSVVTGADLAALDAFTVTGGQASRGGGIYCHKTSPTISNCIVKANKASFGGGIYCEEGSTKVDNCLIIANSSSLSGGGLQCYNSETMITDCIFRENVSSSAGGLLLTGAFPTLTNCLITENFHTATFGKPGAVECLSCSPIFVNCTIADNDISCQAGVFSTRSYPEFVNCVLWNPGSEILLENYGEPSVTYSCVQGGWPGDGNIDNDPLFGDSDLRLRDGSPCVDRGSPSAAPPSDIEGTSRPGGDGLVDMGAYETPDRFEPGSALHESRVLYVKADAPPGGDGLSWDTAFANIGAAMFISGASDEVRVATGLYRESVLMEPNVNILGGYTGIGDERLPHPLTAQNTIIDATGLATPAVTAAKDVVLDGFTIRGGASGGVYCRETSPTISHCIISGNQQGGISIESGSPTISNCTISENTGSGVYCSEGSPAVFECSISENVGSLGGGLYFDESDPTIFRCTIRGNTVEEADSAGGGMFFSSCCSGTVLDCRIVANSAGTGGGVHFCRDVRIELINCVIDRNVAWQDGGGVASWASPVLTNCTIVGNTAGAGSGVFCQFQGNDITMTNCIVWNEGTDICLLESANTSVTYSCVQGGWPGEGNIDDPPQFVDRDNGDYRLRDGSPGIDGGLLSSAPETDIEGNLRPGGDGAVDMGAYESIDKYEPDSIYHENGIIYVRANAQPGGDGLTWNTAFSSISAALYICEPSDEIRVAVGRYFESIGMEFGVDILGGYLGIGDSRLAPPLAAQQTIIDATGQMSSVVIGADRARIDGFTLTGGDTGRGEGIQCRGTSPTATNCIIAGNGRGGVYCLKSSAIISDCTITENRLGSGINCDVSPITLERCTVSKNSAENGAGLYIWSCALEVVDCTFEGNVASLKGGGVYCLSGNLTLNSCTITGNAADVGGGIYGTLSMTECTISGNTAVLEGGGLRCMHDSYYFKDPFVISHCTFSGNSVTGSTGAGGGIHCWDEVPIFNDCIIDRNSAAQGGGMYLRYYGSPTLNNCTISNNYASAQGGGIYCFDLCYPVLTNCQIISNSAGQEGGGLYSYNNCSQTLTNCTFVGNTAAWVGGAAYLRTSSPQMTQCTITGNESGKGAPALDFRHSVPYLKNCIIWNPGQEIYRAPDSTIYATYSCIEDGYPGEGNISGDPRFVKPWDGLSADLRLLPSSPCIDMATMVASVTDDLDGNLRPYDIPNVGFDGDGAGYDMGAYEYSGPFVTPTNTPTFTATWTPTITSTFTPSNTPTPTFVPVHPGDDVACPAWEFNRDGDREGWSGNGQTSGLSVAFGSLSTTCAGWDPQIYSPVGLDLSADFKTVIEIRMRTTAGTIAAIYFKSPADANFIAGKKVLFNLINDQYVTYRIDMKGAAGWSGIIDQLRLDPSNHSGSQVEVDYIRVCLPLFEKAPAWEFNRPARLDGWTVNTHLSDVQVTGGAFQATASGPYPSLYSPIGLGVSAENHPYIETVMDVTAGNRFRVWFRRTGDSDFAPDRCTAVPLSTHPGPAKYLVDMSALPTYTGVIDQIRLNPTDSVGAALNLSAIRFCMPLYEKDPLWNFNNDGDAEGWTAQHDLTEPTVDSGVLKASSTGNDSRLISPYAPMDSRYNRIFLAAMRISQGDFFDLFFCQFGVPGFAGRKRMNIPRHDERVVYAADLGTCPNYADYDVHTLRLDPTDQAGAEVIIDSLGMLTPVRIATKSFEFNNDRDLEGWRGNGQLTAPAVSGGSLRATSTGPDPILFSPAGLSIDADATDQIVLRMKASAGSTAILFYRRATDTGFSSARQKVFRVFNNSEPVSYCLDMSADPNWSGTVVGLRLDPTSVSGADVALDHMRLYGPAAAQ